MDAFSMTPVRPPPTVDIATIEQQKENIQPLASGRSATQLTQLSAQSRSGLGSKLASGHRKYEIQLEAITSYEETGTWENGREDLTCEEAAAMAEDPLDSHHQYVRWVIQSYPAGASATSKLMPLLESSTRRFLNDPRYTNDPRYLRLWNLYAKHTECPMDCYRFLFAKQIGFRLASLYEEYAHVLESSGRRREADQIYLLGINRQAAPLDRLRKRYLEFQARMLVAPPLPETYSAESESASSLSASTSSAFARPILAGNGIGVKASTLPMKENHARGFAVFSDGATDPQRAEGETWEDLGTSKVRRRENTLEVGQIEGETIPMMGAAAKKGNSMKLEVFRDPSSTLTSSQQTLDGPVDRLSKSIRGPSEAEILRQNPLKNYGVEGIDLCSMDPLNGIAVETVSNATKSVNKKSEASTSAVSSKRKPKSNSAGNLKGREASSTSKPTSERVACDLNAVYPEEGLEFSFEELKARANAGLYIDETKSWLGWQWYGEWKEEMERTERSTYEIDIQTEWPLLYDRVTNEPLWDFLMKGCEQRNYDSSMTNDRRLSISLEPAGQSRMGGELLPTPAISSPPPKTHRHSSESPISSSSSSSSSLSPSIAAVAPHEDGSDRRHLHNVNRPPSPTINTRQANAMMESLFSKTLNFGKMNGGDMTDSSEDSDSDSDDGDDDEEGESVAPYWAQEVSQASPSAIAASHVSDVSYAPFLNGHSEADDSVYVSRHGEVEHGLDVGAIPEQLLSSTSASTVSQGDAYLSNTRTTPAYKPMLTRTPFGIKALVQESAKPVSSSPPRGFKVMADAVFDEKVARDQEHGQPSDMVSAFPPASEQGHRSGLGDGFSMGRRPQGTNRYAPFIDNMTPITERTCEITSTTLSTSQRSRRDSVFAITEAVEEEEEEDDEDEDEEEDKEDSNLFRNREDVYDEDADRAFVAEPQECELFAENNEVVSFPNHQTQGFSAEESKPEDLLGPLSIENTSSLAENSSYDAAKETSLPEGYTITGNQSGMTTGMVLAETTNLGNSQDEWEDRSDVGESARPVNPFQPSKIAEILSKASPSVFLHPSVRNLQSIEGKKLSALQKTAKRREAASIQRGKDRTGVIEDAWELELDGELFSVREKLGEGAFGAVFRVAEPVDDEASFDFDVDEVTSLAVKVESPANLWEFFVLDRLHSRLPLRIRDSVVKAKRLYAYQDESFLLMDFCDQGSLLDAVNKANDAGIAPPTGGATNGLEEVVAMFFVIELLRILEGFHSAGFVHGDLKIDNCLIRLEEVPGGTKSWTTAYDRMGGGGWNKKGLKLIDFGRTIDCSTFPPDQRFTCDFETDEFDCLEMREGRPWTFEPDYFGAASIAFNVLFGRYIETKKVSDENDRASYVINQNFKRYHQSDLWNRLFFALLNPTQVRADGQLPIIDELAQIRSDMEAWLERNCDRSGKSLKSLIRKMEMFSMSRDH